MAATTPHPSVAAAPPSTTENDAASASSTQDHHQAFGGQLNKFTNMVKGWQFRWFVLEPEMGTLQYCLPDERATGKCRGLQHLAGAKVLPSEEDEHTFNVHFVTGDVYKLRSANTKERQIWIDRLRTVIERHNEAMSRPSLPIREVLPATPPGSKSHISHGEPSLQLQHLSLSALDALGSVHDILHQADFKGQALNRAIEALPSSKAETGPRSLDEDLLILKATAAASFMAMQQSLAILQGCVEVRRQSQCLTPHISKSILPSPKASSSRSQFFTPSPTKSKSGLAVDSVLSTSTSSLPAATLSEVPCLTSS